MADGTKYPLPTCGCGRPKRVYTIAVCPIIARIWLAALVICSILIAFVLGAEYA